MREIKFRYWDEDNKTMYSLEEIQDLVKDIIPLKKVGYFFLDETIINMQYTGRVDVNGVEIYEGDIVEVTKSFIGTECFKQIGKVVFENGMFIVIM